MTSLGTSDADPPPASTAAAPVAVAAGVLALVGPALPVDAGWAPPLALLGASTAGAWWWSRRASFAQGAASETTVALTWLRFVGALVLIAAAGRAVGGLLVAFPAASASLLAAVLGAVVLAVMARRFGGAPRLLGAALAVAIPAAALGGAAWEERVPGAHGSATSGPILGIHPFQITAVALDGYGPVDIPFNDYVEPDATRGYGPAELAAALELALHATAELWFADGPARARKAFGEARVEAIVTRGVYERLDREPEFGWQPRYVVHSGTYGPGSRVEFRCPGERNDPRPREADNVLAKMCPDKYAAEASAGLGLTGRWAGYSETRGQAGVSLAGVVGAPTGEDAAGRETRRAEVMGWVLLMLLAAGVVVGVVGPRPAFPVGVDRVALGALLVVMVALLGIATVGFDGTVVAPVERPATGAPASHASWLALLALPWLAALRGASPVAVPVARPRGAGRGVLAVAGLVAVATAAAAASRGTTAFATPDTWALGDLPLRVFVEGVASGLASTTGLEVQQVEALVAGVLVLCLWSAVLGLMAPITALPGGRWTTRVATLAALAGGALALATSRATGGAAALILPAVTLALAVELGPRLPSRGVAGVGARLAAASAVAWAVTEPLRHGVAPSAVLVGATAFGVVCGALALRARPGPGARGVAG